MFKIEVLKGAHRVKGELNEKGERMKGRTYKMGEVFESKIDLAKREPARYARVGGSGPSDIEESVDIEDLAKANTSDLMKLAKSLNIDLGGATKKKDMIELIQLAMLPETEEEAEEESEEETEE